MSSALTILRARTCSLGLLCYFALVLTHAEASQVVGNLREPRAREEFPATISFSHNGVEHRLAITGLAVRKRFFLSIYSMAHYMENTPRGDAPEVFQAILEDRGAKQITMHFVRDVSRERIQRALVEGFHKNATDAELRNIQPFVRQFAGALDKDVKENEKFIIRWLPGGTTMSLFHGEEVTTIKSLAFARVLWSIWFGERSVVDRNALIEIAGARP